MALHLTRLAVQRQFVGCYFRGLNYPSVRLVTIKAVPAAPPSTETFDEKNARLRRPQSPHLSIYKPQLTALMSVSHRGTGMALGAYMTMLGLGALVTDTPTFIEYVNSFNLHEYLIYAGKAAVAFPAAYHFANGFRHLMWDAGQFLTIKGVYLTGYTTLLISVLLTAWILTL